MSKVQSSQWSVKEVSSKGAGLAKMHPLCFPSEVRSETLPPLLSYKVLETLNGSPIHDPIHQIQFIHQIFQWLFQAIWRIFKRSVLKSPRRQLHMTIMFEEVKAIYDCMSSCCGTHRQCRHQDVLVRSLKEAVAKFGFVKWSSYPLRARFSVGFFFNHFIA